MNNTYDTFVVVGAGGIGAQLAPILAKLMAFKLGGGQLIIVDGDEIEDGNLSRQYGEADVGQMKAVVLAEKCQDAVPEGKLEIVSICEYIKPNTLNRYHQEWVKDNVIVFGCVDNNKTRVYLEELVSGLETSVLISAGNDEFTGQSQLYVRQDGVDITPRITEWAPEILDTSDKGNVFPGEEDCTGEYESKPQLILANLSAAVSSLNLLYGHVLDQTPRAGTPNEIKFDVREGRMKVFTRKPIPIGKPATTPIL